MNTAVKFITLYLIPVMSFAVYLSIYLHGHGKDSEDTYINLGFIFGLCAVVASSTLAFILIRHFLTDQTNYLGILFSIIPWVAAIIVTIYALRILGW